VVLLALLLLGPDLAEFGVPGLVTLRWRVRAQEERLAAADQRAAALEAQLAQVAASSSVASSAAKQEVTINLAALASGDETARLAAGEGTSGDAELPDVVVEARFLAAERALAALMSDVPDELAPATLHLYYPSEDEQLLPVFEPDRPAEEVGWPFGVGVVGEAWTAAAVVSREGTALRDDVGHLEPQRTARYDDLVAVTAVPGHRLDSDAAVEVLTLQAALAARVLVDLLGWDDDSPGDDADLDDTDADEAGDGAAWSDGHE
jgi:hypothetical protein